MSEFETSYPAFRVAQTHFGDTMQDVAARELGDANRWIELVWLNNLTYPFLTDEPTAPPGVISAGGDIRIPSVAGVSADLADDGEGFERDCLMIRRRLVAEDGDFAIVSGTANLKQQLTHRINTPMGQARRHPSYGCRVWQIKGRINGPLAGALGAGYVKASLAADYRVRKVTSSAAEIVGDAVRITGQIEAVSGGTVDVVTANS